MPCGLKRTLGVEARCESSACVFWRRADVENGMPEGCVIVQYELTGQTADRTARWLHDYKVSTDRSRVAALMREVHSADANDAHEPRAADRWNRTA